MADESKSAQPFSLKRIHHIEFWVGNAKQASFYYRKAFGFSQLAYAGLETGCRDKASYVMEQGKIRFVFSTPLQPDGPLSEHIRAHGDGVRDVAFEVDDVDKAFATVVERGAEPLEQPHDVSDDHGSFRRASIKTYGDTIHSLVAPKAYDGPFMPGYQPARIKEPDCGLTMVDHVVGNVELGAMNTWADFYAKVFGFHRYITFDDKDISTEYSALMSVVMSDDNKVVKFPINEPAAGKKKSQIEEYIDFYGSAGVQHVAMLTDDIVETIKALVERGVEFLYVPETYYDDVKDRVGSIDEPLEAIRPLGILIDRDDEGYLLQLFTKPVEDRPTVFYEIIQRKGARGFGKGNFKALFESIEREQERRGTL